jgi:hypothetical protein
MRAAARARAGIATWAWVVSRTIITPCVRVRRLGELETGGREGEGAGERGSREGRRERERGRERGKEGRGRGRERGGKEWER